MRDQNLLYSHPISYSDDTIYSGASITTSSNDSATSSNSSIMSRSTLTQKDVVGPKQVRRQKSRTSPSNQNYPNHPADSGQQQFVPRTGHGSPFSAFDLVGEPGGRGLRDGNIDLQDNDRQQSHHANSSGVGLSRTQSQHGRSVSLLSRLRHSSALPLAPSPAGSPTSSENSSRDTRSERTLAHSASSGSMRITSQQQQRLEVRVLPPTGNQADDGPSDKAAKRRNSKRRSGSSGSSGGGFISQLLRGHSRHSPQPPSSSGHQQGSIAANVGHFVKSPDTSGNRGSVGAGAGGAGSAGDRSPAANSAERAEMSSDRGFSGYSGNYCAPNAADYYTEDSGDTGSQSDSSAIEPNHSAGSYGVDSSNFSHIQPLGLDNTGAALASSQWFQGGDSGSNSGDDPLHMAGRLVSALPVYEPINMARLTAISAGSGAYTRATQPTLPDARMLAPMASLAEVFGATGMGEYSSLSNRELRFAVENHMLVEQHRYLIRDLGHARSAIAALKQVVHAKEERLDHYEAANGDLQQRVAILESVLTPEQRQQVACLPYAFSVYSHSIGPSAASHVLGVQSLEGSRQEQQSAADNNLSVSILSSASADKSESQISTTGSQQSQDSDARRVNRPLSGYATGFSFNDKPVHHLPRVFSGDYSSADVQAMETSVGVLANAIKSMPRDEHSVEDIIASKLADEKQEQRNGASAGSVSTKGNLADESSAEATQSKKERRKSKRAQTASSTLSSPAEPKRRSRFFSALRLSGFGQTNGPMSPASGDASSEPTNKGRSRRSVSLGNGNLSVASSSQETTPASRDNTSTAISISNTALPKRVRSDSHESLAASCPSLFPGIIGAGRQANNNRPSSRKPSSGSVSSEGSASGRYPEGLGLGGYGSERSCSSAQASHRIGSNSSGGNNDRDSAKVTDNRGRRSRIANRLSFTPQPRRSTSAPSRPQSMQVERRRSWFSRLFDSSDNRISDKEASSGNVTDDDATDNEMAGAAGKARRRRVMTQSTDEVSQYLGKLKLEDAPSSRGGGSNVLGGRGGGVLEDVIDVSGEDEEKASRPSLSVAEIRQQTLDALNGTLRTGARLSQDSVVPTRISSLPQQRPQMDDLESLSPSTENHLLLGENNVGRWRQREAAKPTIRRLSINQSATCNNGGSLGLGVSVTNRCDTHSDKSDESTPLSVSMVQSSDKEQSAASLSRRDQPQDARTSSGGSTASNSEIVGSKKWAPAFWAPPPLPFHGANSSAVNSPSGSGGVSSPWSPGDAGDSFENASSICSRLSEDARYRSPRGSIGVSTRRGSGNGGSTNGGNASPWELVKIPAESRTFPLSPSHSRPGTPPSRSLGFFEDTTVPDSDELTMAARRSLSLRMSRNAFMQAEPLPESDDVAESSTSSSLRAVASGNVNGGKNTEGLVTDQYPVRNAVLARVAASEPAQPKRRSLLWQFNSKSSSTASANGNGKVLSGPTCHSNDRAGHQKAADAASVASDSAYEDADGDNSRNSIHPSTDEASLSTTNTDAPPSTSNAAGKRSRKWWSAVLG